MDGQYTFAACFCALVFTLGGIIGYCAYRDGHLEALRYKAVVEMQAHGADPLRANCAVNYGSVSSGYIMLCAQTKQ